MQSGKSEHVTVVTGIGLNVNIPQRIDFDVESDWAHRAVDLKSVGLNLPGRELLAGTLVDYLFLTFKRFEESGLQGFMGEWRANDWLLGREITVDMPDKQITGTAAGIAEDGALLVDTNNGQARVISGSIVMAGPKEQGA